MTLVLTELSEAGIAMAADSAITKLSRDGKITEIDQQGWRKLLTVPSITAAISYWGMIGLVTKVQFDIWLGRAINSNNYHDLPSLADHLAGALNEACGNKPLRDGGDVGIHVAGYHAWPDGKERPTFYHVHNGHGRFSIHEEKDSQGRLVAVRPRWDADPRKLFESHSDFPPPSQSLEQSLAILRQGYMTRNGDFFIYAIIGKHLRAALHYVNLVPEISLPRDPSDISSRKGFIHVTLDMMVKLYRCSNQSLIIGGTVTSLGIRHNGYVP